MRDLKCLSCLCLLFLQGACTEYQGKKEGRYHFFSDASMNVTGGVGMFAGCCIQSVMLRQHPQAPDAHASELVGAGTNIHQILPVNGLLQELGLRRGKPTVVYFDSLSTVFVASSDAAPKKSVWLQRRAKVVTETVEHGEIAPVHIDEADMVADSYTKYIKHDKWVRHMHYVLNLPGDPPNYACVRRVLERHPTTMRVNSIRPMLLAACTIACKVSRDGNNFGLWQIKEALDDVLDVDETLLASIEHQMLEMLKWSLPMGNVYQEHADAIFEAASNQLGRQVAAPQVLNAF